MSTADVPLSDPGRGGLRAVRWARLLQDHEALIAAARTSGVVVGTYRAGDLRKHGVGVVQLWPPSPPRSARQVPRGIQAFQATTAPPASTLWAASGSAEGITASLHVEFVGGIARVCEAVDVGSDGVGSTYVLRLEPVGTAVACCLDVLGFGPDGGTDFARLRASFPWQWSADGGRPRPERLAEDRVRDLVARFSATPGSSPTLTDQVRARCPDVPALPDQPTRADVAAVLDAFFAGG